MHFYALPDHRANARIIAALSKAAIHIVQQVALDDNLELLQK